MKRALAIAVVSLGTVPWVPTPASASCIGASPMPKAIREAPAVFVGTVVETANSRRWVTVEVSAVWKGDVEPEVEVRAGPKDPPGPGGVATSVDRHYRDGETYLFLPYHGDGKTFRDSNCSRTTRYEANLERFRPTSASDPSGSPSSEPGPGGVASRQTDEEFPVLWWIAGAGVVILGVLLAVSRNRRGSA